jgi:hypothetical protein
MIVAPSDPFKRAQALKNAYQTKPHMRVYWCPIVKKTNLIQDEWDLLNNFKDNPIPGVERPDFDVSHEMHDFKTMLKSWGNGTQSWDDILQIMPIYFGDGSRSDAAWIYADVTKRFPDWVALHRGHNASASLGLWEENGKTDLTVLDNKRWTPEINFVHDYDLPMRKSKNFPFSRFIRLVREFSLSMWQNAIMIVFEDDDDLTQEVYFIESSPKKQDWRPSSTKRLRAEFTFNVNTKPSNRWQFHLPRAESWREQFNQFHRAMQTCRDQALLAVLQQQDMATTCGLGATLESDGKNPNILNVMVCGGARFLFAPRFWHHDHPALPELANVLRLGSLGLTPTPPNGTPSQGTSGYHLALGTLAGLGDHSASRSVFYIAQSGNRTRGAGACTICPRQFTRGHANHPIWPPNPGGLAGFLHN